MIGIITQITYRGLVFGHKGEERGSIMRLVRFYGRTISYTHKIWVFSSDTHTIEPSKDVAFSYKNPSDPSLASTNKFRLSTPNSFYDGNPLVSHAIGLHGESWLNVTYVAASQRPAL